MVIASIAQSRLRPAVLAEAQRLLMVGASPKANDFITASVWADDVTQERPESRGWHYVNNYFRADGSPSDKKPEAENALTAMARFSAVLKDRSKPDAERANALRFLIHIAADLHQPLHASSRIDPQHPDGDRGGNDVPVKLLEWPETNTAPKNLHALWDSGAGLFPQIDRPLNDADRRLIRVQAVSLIAAIPPKGPFRPAQMRPEVWAQEGLLLAKDVAYAFPDGGEINGWYLRAAQSACAHRSVAAGYRLAQLLNTLLAP